MYALSSLGQRSLALLMLTSTIVKSLLLRPSIHNSIFSTGWCQFQLPSISNREMATARGSALGDINYSGVKHPILPELVVFDLDMCIWHPEMYTLRDLPTEKSRIIGKLMSSSELEGVVAVKSNDEQIRLFPAALRILQEYALGAYPGMKIGIASSSDTPLAVSIARKALDYLEVLPGLSVRQVFQLGWNESHGPDFEGHIQIGRSVPLSKDKSRSHFPIIRDRTGVAFNRMLYFDDCTWDDHVYMVEERCKGVTAIRTPNGIQYDEWERGLSRYVFRRNDAAIDL